MTEYLKHLFPSFGRMKTTVQNDCPEWTVGDAVVLAGFLDTPTGKKMMDRFRHSVTAMVCDPKPMDEATRAERRSVAWMITGLQSLADVEFWRKRGLANRQAEDKGEDL